MAVYHDWVLSGRGVKGTVSSGDSAYDTIVRNSASLRVSSGGYIERTQMFNTTLSNAGSAVSTVLSGGTMTVSRGGVAVGVSVLRNARLTVSKGGVATDVGVVSNGNVNATVYGNDDTTLIDGTNELGHFFLSGGTAANFVLNSTGMLTVISGGTALDTNIRANGVLTVSGGGVATGIVQSKGGKLTVHVRGGDPLTLVSGTNDYGTFLLSGGTASGFVLYENAAQYISSGGTALNTLVSSTWAHQYVSSGGFVSATSVCDKGSMTVYGAGVARDTVVASGGSMMAAGGHIAGVTVAGLLQITTATAGADESATASELENVFILSGGVLDVTAGAKYSGTVDIRGTLKISSGITMNGLVVKSGGSAVVGGVFNVAASTWNTTVDSTGRMTVSSGGEALGVAVSTGGMLTVSSGGVAVGVDQKAGGRINAVVRGGDSVTSLFGSNESGTFLVSDGAASGFIVYSGAVLTVLAGGAVTDAEVRSGGRIAVAPDAGVGGRLVLDFADSPNAVGLLSDLSRVSSGAVIVLSGISAPGTYVLADSGSVEATVHCMPSGLYDSAIRPGESAANAFYGLEHVFDTAGRVVTATSAAVTQFSSAAALDGAAAWRSNDRAAKWTEFSAAPGAVLDVVEEEFGGDAWLELDGTDLAGTTLYGADTNFSGTVNILATSGATLGNLAAGAAAGGAVGGVKLTVDGATLGLSYAGGFGSVSGRTETLIADGTFTKDFYAGALANYNKTHTATSAGAVALTVEGGTFAGNIYGAASVKAGEAGAHAVSGVTLKLGGGTAERSDFCCFAGGYATGSAAATTVCTVGGVDLDVSGGSWGEARGGRGIFGGVFASGVTAAAEDVTITVSGGTFGNVYGGGWAQKGGTSVVGDVRISIAGGTVANVFGGGSHSTSGGATVAGDVTITVAGGSVTGTIYAKGQYAGDSVDGENVTVTFTGAGNRVCDVFGYSYEGGSGDSDALIFADCTGSFTGSIGGFDGIEISGNTALTLAPAEGKSVSGNAWLFDVAERDAASAGEAMLVWSGADFSERTITLNLAEDNAVAWTLVSGTAAFGEFNVWIDGSEIAAGLALGDAIEDTGTVCDNWGFALEAGALKFRQLA